MLKYWVDSIILWKYNRYYAHAQTVRTKSIFCGQSGCKARSGYVCTPSLWMNPLGTTPSGSCNAIRHQYVAQCCASGINMAHAVLGIISCIKTMALSCAPMLCIHGSLMSIRHQNGSMLCIRHQYGCASCVNMAQCCASTPQWCPSSISRV